MQNTVFQGSFDVFLILGSLREEDFQICFLKNDLSSRVFVQDGDFDFFSLKLTFTPGFF